MAQPAKPHRRLSQAEHHRRRRRVALAAAASMVLGLVVVVAAGAGGGGTWNPVALREAAVTELPRLRLEEQARRAAIAIAHQKQARKLENAAIARTLRQTPYVRWAGAQTRSVALTFDDGPSPYTERILDTLGRSGAKATFFALGNQLSQFPLPLQRAVAEGNSIGDHTWNHADLTKLSTKEARREIRDAVDGLEQARIPRPALFRPPYMAYNAKVLAVAKRERMLTVLWTIDSNDYEATKPKAMAAQVLAQVRPGAIILMHDGGGDRTVTGRALPLIVRGLKQRGYRMLTVPQLLMANPAPASQDPVAPSAAP